MDGISNAVPKELWARNTLVLCCSHEEFLRFLPPEIVCLVGSCVCRVKRNFAVREMQRVSSWGCNRNLVYLIVVVFPSVDFY